MSSVVLIAQDEELDPDRRVWGTGGWVMPDYREALDWLTFVRVLGWPVEVMSLAGAPPPAERLAAARCLIVGCDPRVISPDWIAVLDRALTISPLMVLVRAGPRDGPAADIIGVHRRGEISAGCEWLWRGPGSHRGWRTGRFEAHALDAAPDGEVWASLDGAPVIVAVRRSAGAVVTLGFHPSAARDHDGALTSLLRHLLVFGPQTPAAWFDFENTMVLRMDDPGGAQNVHKRDWRYPKLDENAWRAIGDDLARRGARLSIGYTSGWVDDGDPQRGHLIVDGRRPKRTPGQIYPSPHVVYEDVAGHAPGTMYDYRSEYRGIQNLRAAGLGDVELHGYTHMHPDTVAWGSADNRYEVRPWFRELGINAAETLSERSAHEHPLTLGMTAIESFFGARPTTLIPPGDEWTDLILEHALDLGLHLVDSYYLAVRHDRRFCWSTHVCSPYLDTAESSWFHAGLPVVGYFHDYEPAVHGLEWMQKWLDQWQEAGSKRFIDFRELAAALGRHVSLHNDGVPTLEVKEVGGPNLVRPLRVAIAMPGRTLPSELVVRIHGTELMLPVAAHVGGAGLVEIPSSPP